MPIIELREVPSQNDFQEKSQDHLLKEKWHSTIVTEDGQKIDAYFMYSGRTDGDLVSIFYFEDDSDDVFEGDSFYPADYFVFDIVRDSIEKPNFIAFVDRTGQDCVKVPDEQIPRYSSEGDCSEGAVITKETKNGWAAYVKFFSDFPKPDKDSPYELKWVYVDAKEFDEDRIDQSKYHYWPDRFQGYGTIEMATDETDESFVVNTGRLATNNFLYTPFNTLTQGLKSNQFQCADNTVTVSANAEIYDKEDVARISAVFNTDSEAPTVKLTVYDENDRTVFKKSTKVGENNDALFLVDLDEFNDGIYRAVVEYGVNGPSDYVKFGVNRGDFEQEPDEKCKTYLVYDESDKSLYIVSKITDPSGFSSDNVQYFIDRDGSGGVEVETVDFRYIIDKGNFGGAKITGDSGWASDQNKWDSGQARINKISDGYEVLVKVNDVNKDFKLAMEQTDRTFYDFKKTRIPDNAFSTTPASWATTNFESGDEIKKLQSDGWIPHEVVVSQNLDVNLILVGDTWTESLKNRIKPELTEKYLPIVSSELHLAGIEYNYIYNFVSAPDETSQKVFDHIKQNSEAVKPFFGEDSYEEPWGIASWIKHNHTEWADQSQQRFEIEYKLMDAESLESFLYQEIVSKDPSLNKPNSVNLIFLADSPDKIEFLHNYKVTKKDSSTDRKHTEIGLMGYGGNYNLYYFDLYAFPWDPYQGLQGFYDPNKISQFSNFHDLKTDKQRGQLLANYINNSTNLLITPSYLYPPLYKQDYLIDLVIVTERGSTAIVTTIDHFIDEAKVISVLEEAIPHSKWNLKSTLEKIDSRNLPSDLKTVINSAEPVPIFFEGGPTVDVLDEDSITEEVVGWAGTRESTDPRDLKKISDSKWVIPILVVIGERDSPFYIGNYGVVGKAPAHPDDDTQACCALAVTYDNAVWDDNVGLTSLVAHEAGHVVGLMHPFMGYDTNHQFFVNDYFNWYDSSMVYNSAPNGCGLWFLIHVGEPCGNVNTEFSKFEKQSLAKGVTAHLLKSAKNNIYRTVLEYEENGNDPNNLPPEINNSIDSIQRNIEQAVNHLQKNELSYKDGSIFYALEAATEAQKLTQGIDVQYKTVGDGKPDLKIPSWIRDQAEWWVEGSISDADFINGIQYLIKERIIVLPDIPESEKTGRPNDMPDWVKNNVRWWSKGTISDQEMVSALQFLIKEGIIVV